MKIKGLNYKNILSFDALKNEEEVRRELEEIKRIEEELKKEKKDYKFKHQIL